MSFSKQSPREVYLDSIANEMRRDIFMHEKFGLSKRTKIIVPRIEKILGFATGQPQAFVALTSLARIIWRPLLFPVLLCVQGMLSLIYLRNGKWAGSTNSSVFVATSETAFQVLDDTSRFDVHLRLFRSKNGREGDCHLWYFADIRDVGFAIQQSWSILIPALDRYTEPGAEFQVYTAFRWFLSWRVLDKLSPSIQTLAFVSDSDSWAVLFDEVCGVNGKVLLQHGLLSDPNGNQISRPNTPLPRRLRTVTLVEVLDEKSIDLFRQNVLAPECRPEFCFQQAKGISIVPLDNEFSNFFQVLVVGQPEHIKKECRFASMFLDSVKLACVIIKPHPNFSSVGYRRLRRPRLNLVVDPDVFPLVDLVVSFGESTLLEHYRKFGTTVLVEPELSLEQLVNLAIDKLPNASS